MRGDLSVEDSGAIDHANGHVTKFCRNMDHAPGNPGPAGSALPSMPDSGSDGPIGPNHDEKSRIHHLNRAEYRLESVNAA
jgi:hypothetical protein